MIVSCACPGLVTYINHKYGRTGTLWEGRFKSSLVDSDFYVLTCMRYIEMNPVRAKMVESPQDYKWSSYGINAFDSPDRLITPHASYLGLSGGKKQRRAKYIDLFSEHLDIKTLNAIRNCAQTGTPLGGSQFIKQIEDKLKVKVGYSTRGRPWNTE
ncbi:MAG: transposase [Marinicella sp.]